MQLGDGQHGGVRWPQIAGHYRLQRQGDFGRDQQRIDGVLGEGPMSSPSDDVDVEERPCRGHGAGCGTKLTHWQAGCVVDGEQLVAGKLGEEAVLDRVGRGEAADAAVAVAVGQFIVQNTKYDAQS